MAVRRAIIISLDSSDEIFSLEIPPGLFLSRLMRQLSDDQHSVLTPIYEPSGKNVQLFGFLFNRLYLFIHLSLFQRAMGAAIKVVTLIEQATKLQWIKLRRNIIPLTEFRYSARLWYYSNP